MMQRIILAFLISGLLAFGACSRCPETSEIKEALNENQDDTETLLAPDRRRLSEEEKEMIWSSLFGVIYHNGFRPNQTDFGMDGDLVYRVTSKTAVDIENLESKNLLSKNLVDSFRFENKSPERLPTEELSIWPVFPFDRRDEVRELFYNAKKLRRRKTAAAVVFSNIGFNPIKRECLVYVEYFKEQVGLSKFWLHFTLDGYPLDGAPEYKGLDRVRLIDPDKLSNIKDE